MLELPPVRPGWPMLRARLFFYALAVGLFSLALLVPQLWVLFLGLAVAATVLVAVWKPEEPEPAKVSPQGVLIDDVLVRGEHLQIVGLPGRPIVLALEDRPIAELPPEAFDEATTLAHRAAEILGVDLFDRRPHHSWDHWKRTLENATRLAFEADLRASRRFHLDIHTLPPSAPPTEMDLGRLVADVSITDQPQRIELDTHYLRYGSHEIRLDRVRDAQILVRGSNVALVVRMPHTILTLLSVPAYWTDDIAELAWVAAQIREAAERAVAPQTGTRNDVPEALKAMRNGRVPE